MRRAARTLELLWYLCLMVFVFSLAFFFLCAHVHNISPFGILLRFICFSSPLCQSSRLTASQVMEKSHGWVSRFSCLLFFIPLFPAWCTMSWPQSFPSPLFFPKFLFSVVHNPFYPLSSSSPTLSFSASFILSLICHGPLFAPPIGPHLPIPQQPLTTVCVTGALNLNQCAQVKHILHTCFAYTHTQSSYIVTAVYASAGELCLYFMGEAASVQIDGDCDRLPTMLCFCWLCYHWLGVCVWRLFNFSTWEEGEAYKHINTVKRTFWILQLIYGARTCSKEVQWVLFDISVVSLREWWD